MSVILEVYYRPPADDRKEAALMARVARLGGRLSFHEVPETNGDHGICLTYEFDDLNLAQIAAQTLREQGEHVEGPSEYGQ